MSDADKNIQITPSTNQTNEPTILFTGANNNTLTLRTLDDGTLSFEGSVGQLFSISDTLTGTIFSVNDLAGVPAIEVDDSGVVKLAEFGGNVRIGSNVVIDTDGNILINNENVIPEHGSNANGSFTKFPDGTLICTVVGASVGGTRSTLTNVLGSTSGTIQAGSDAFTFPFAFVSSPICAMNLLVSSQNGANYKTRNLTATGGLAVVYYPDNTTTVGFTVIAIGRWK